MANCSFSGGMRQISSETAALDRACASWETRPEVYGTRQACGVVYWGFFSSTGVPMTIENSAAQSMLCVGGSEEEVVPPAPPALSSSRRAISSGCRLRSSPRCHPGRRFNQAGVLMEAGASDPNPAILYLFYKRNAGPVTNTVLLLY